MIELALDSSSCSTAQPQNFKLLAQPIHGNILTIPHVDRLLNLVERGIMNLGLMVETRERWPMRATRPMQDILWGIPIIRTGIHHMRSLHLITTEPILVWMEAM